jgi:hypothetical protein
MMDRAMNLDILSMYKRYGHGRSEHWSWATEVRREVTMLHILVSPSLPQWLDLARRCSVVSSIGKTFPFAF